MNKVIKFIGRNALTIALAFIPPILIWVFFQREHRSIQVTLLADVPIVSLNREFASDIEIRYKGQPVSSLSVINLEIKNDGNRPIQRNDFDTPLKFIFNGDVLPAPQVIRVTPETLVPELKITEPSRVELEPLLLNRKDGFTFQVRVANRRDSEKNVTLEGRVVGVSAIQIQETRKESRSNKAILEYVLTILTCIVSAASLVRVLKEAGSAARLQSELKDAASRALQLQVEASTPSETEQLAKDLQITQHTRKANVLLLRLRIETLLREIGQKAKLSDRELVGSMTQLVRALVSRQMLADEVGAALMDVIPVFNRELHTIDTYLSQNEFRHMQDLALSVIVALEKAKSKAAGGR